MSISSRSRHNNPFRPGRRHWAVGITAAIALGLMISWVGAAPADAPELRLARTGGTITAQLIDGEHAIFVANAGEPTEARAAIGILNRPWETKPSVIIAGADDQIVDGLWEAVRRLSPDQLIVLGAPGASDEWLLLERFCRGRGIEIRYLERSVQLVLDELTLALVPNAGSGAHLVASSRSMRVVVEVGGLPDSGRFHAAVGRLESDGRIYADLMVRPTGADTLQANSRYLSVGSGRRVTLVVESERIRVRGGKLATTAAAD